MTKTVFSVIKILAVTLCLPGILVGFLLALPGFLLLVFVEGYKDAAKGGG